MSKFKLTFQEGLLMYTRKFSGEKKAEKFFNNIMLNLEVKLPSQAVIKYDKHFANGTNERWEKEKQDTDVIEVQEYRSMYLEFRSMKVRFLHHLDHYRVPCFLMRNTGHEQEKAGGYAIYTKYEQEILENLGVLNLEEGSYTICFQLKLFEDFMEKVSESYNNIDELLSRGAHDPEWRALKRVLEDLSDDKILLLKKSKKNKNNRPQLWNQLQEWEPDLKDERALERLTVLVNKLPQSRK